MTGQATKGERRWQGQRLRDAAIDQVEEHSPLAAEALFDVACRIAYNAVEFTADDIWDAAGISVREPRVMGPVMRRLSREGIAWPTGRTRQAHRGVNHARPQAIWSRRRP